MKLLVIIVSLLTAFWAEGILVRIPLPYRIEPPLVFLVLFYWLWQIEDTTHFFTLLCGAILVLESTSMFASGSYMVTLLTAAGILFILKKLLAKKESTPTQAVAAGIYLVWIGVSLPAYENFFLWFHGGKNFSPIFLTETLWWAGCWAFLFALIIIITHRYFPQ